MLRIPPYCPAGYRVQVAAGQSAQASDRDATWPAFVFVITGNGPDGCPRGAGRARSGLGHIAIAARYDRATISRSAWVSA